MSGATLCHPSLQMRKSFSFDELRKNLGEYKIDNLFINSVIESLEKPLSQALHLSSAVDFLRSNYTFKTLI